MSARYTHGHHESVLRSHTQRSAENSAAYLLPHLRPGMTLLDAGCGPGTITADLALRVAPGRVVAVDAATGVLAQAEGHARDRGITTISFQEADVYALPFPGATFDAAHAHQVLQHLADPVAALRELRRVTRPGGVVAVRDVDYASMVWAPLDPRLDRWLALYRAVARRNGGEPDAARHLRAWALAAGFSEVTVTGSSWTWADEEMCAWWGGLWADRATKSDFAPQAVNFGLTTREEMDEIADAFRAWAAAPAAFWSMLHGEVIARV